MIGELNATFLFETGTEAKAAWETVAGRCKNIGLNRWTVPGFFTDDKPQAVTVLTEAEFRNEYETARELLKHGREIDTPPFALEAFITKRIKNFQRGGDRETVRNPLGTYMGPGGINLGPVRRPQG